MDNFGQVVEPVKKKNKAIFRIVLALVVAIFVVGGIFVFLSNFEISRKGDGLKVNNAVGSVSGVGSVCGLEDIEKFNNFYMYNFESYDELGDIISNIEGRGGYEGDPNCVFMILSYYRDTDNGERANDAYNKISDLSGAGLNPSLSLYGIKSLEQIAPLDDSIENGGEYVEG